MKRDLTLQKIKNTKFNTVYNDFIIGQGCNEKQYRTILALAICFINAVDENVQHLGYRIIVDYCNKVENYGALYEIAINKGLYPVSKFIEKHYVSEEDKNFFTEWNDSFTEQYAFGNIYQTEQQFCLRKFFFEKKNDTLSVIAPTSYGKSELINSIIEEFAGKNVCILTSTKALLMQTKKRIKDVCKGRYKKIVVHPEMYNPCDENCLAVLTQERLLRLFKKYPEIVFDCIVVDEAHEILEDNSRSKNLANNIIVAQKRNHDTVFKFLTPFLENPDNLKTRYTTYGIEGFKVSEYIKSEKYYIYDLRQEKGLTFYDQFMNGYIHVPEDKVLENEEEVVNQYSENKNIIYLNKPTDIEKFSIALADSLPNIESDLIENACKNISSYLQPQYNLLKCLKKGIIYHHGSVPDSVRLYIEELYKQEKDIKYVITSSTLLAGVNLPAEAMFILDSKRGRANLRRDAFQNLVGRVCRFSEIFDDVNGSLKLLEPKIYIVFGKYFAQNANCKKFLSNVAKVEKKYQDEVSNVLLSETTIDERNSEEFVRANEFIENYENGVIKDYNERYVATDVGKSCILNGITEIDVFESELEIQANIDKARGMCIDNTDVLMECIFETFLKYLPEDGEEAMGRLKNIQARKFYAMMLDWRIENKSYSEMIMLFIKYWRNLKELKQNTVLYVGKWGDHIDEGGRITHYTDIAQKDYSQLVNLAIVRIKEEQDFIDNYITKFIEVLKDMDLLEDGFYNQIKYGTDDEKIITLIKNGITLSAAVLLLKKYESYLHIDTPSSTVNYDEGLIDAMMEEKENEILVSEVKNCI